MGRGLGQCVGGFERDGQRAGETGRKSEVDAWSLGR